MNARLLLLAALAVGALVVALVVAEFVEALHAAAAILGAA